MDETYRKAGKMDSGRFASLLDPLHTDLIKIVRGYLLEGSESKRDIKVELYKLNIYGKYLPLRLPLSDIMLLFRQGVIL